MTGGVAVDALKNGGHIVHKVDRGLALIFVLWVVLAKYQA